MKESLFDALEDGVAAFRLGDGKLETHNERFLEWLGFAEGTSFHEAFAVDVEEMRAKVLSQKRPPTLVREIRPPKGRDFPAEITFTAFPKGAEPTHLLAHARNISRVHEKDAMLKSFTTTIDINNRLLAREKKGLANLLDNMRQAVFTVDAKGHINDPVSRFSQNVFGVDIARKGVFDVLFACLPTDGEEISNLKTLFATAFGACDVQWMLMEDTLPKRLLFSHPDKTERVLKTSYVPLWSDDGTLERIMFVIEDVTLLEALERAVDAERKLSQRKTTIVTELLSAPEGELVPFFERVGSLVEDIRVRVELGANNSVAPLQHPELMRDLHTLKGSARMLGFHQLSVDVHGAEHVALGNQARMFDATSASREENDANIRTRLLETLTLFDEYAGLARRFFGAGQSGTGVGTFGASAHGADWVRSFGTRIGALVRMAQDIAHQLGKEVAVEVVGADVHLPEPARFLLEECLLHILCNGIDHGIEGPENRQSLGKSRVGTLKVKFELGPNIDGVSFLQVDVADDGKGIDPVAISAACVRKGLKSESEITAMTDLQKQVLVFLPGLTTVSEANEISGRGVGMDIINTRLRDCGGSLAVTSMVGKGTTFTLTFPVRFEK